MALILFNALLDVIHELFRTPYDPNKKPNTFKNRIKSLFSIYEIFIVIIRHLLLMKMNQVFKILLMLVYCMS